ncbi:MAG: phosphotransferase [Eubacterium sp.]|nr:phosphotransferase [Eubacterium sp.]
MIILTKENVAEYVHSRLDFFNIQGKIQVSAVGEGSTEEDGDGFINFVFRVSDGEHHLIVKQSTVQARSGGSFQLDINRYKLEYDSLLLRRAIVPDLVPAVYDLDTENRVFITEDVSYLKISRFQLLKGVQFPLLGEHIGRYMAANNFYTSEYYLESKVFRDLSVHFMNATMREIMDVGMFLNSTTPEDTVGRPLDPDFITFSRRVCADPAIIVSRQRLRHLFMTKGECLIHGDLHTSNIFASDTEAKVIDMEYTFCGPFSYDMGYFLQNFLTQYAAATFRPFDSENDREAYKAYCLFIIKDTYESFCKYFCHYFRRYAKPEYRDVPGLLDDFCLTSLREFIGFSASAMLGRIVGVIPFPDYDDIADPVQRHNAMCYSIVLNHQMLLHWDSYRSIDEFLDDIRSVEKIYVSNIKALD